MQDTKISTPVIPVAGLVAGAEVLLG
jgi:hypothetical protein